ncbi:TPA_exp: Uncharacterized protein A8136_2796 [Trichophyton benhamiae CBS 112371]|uniref:Uncharacterized protein n=1 Tax=Arthroderma benhamiae (strain ATCC MYA-4681 / CBS 112371) TaxID=663331 RepID=D4ALE4_ARTBC|nr:uncharacterized protein ARB_05141 [Trichophyton benhamiae CBS 112371]EFE36203.1 hypothetical protein ARB_05141 [Trichophyton benhamiae CBS 112371]DAA79011.1 TPA_exp: Uncharacterized protein A8136_2796 [Trichophyton benhamiae CBS 112371]
MFRACQFIKYITTSAGRQIRVAFVTKTDVWERAFLSKEVQNEFAAVAEKYKDTIKPETVTLAMKEAEHPSQNDPAKHFTVFELDKDEKVVASKHYYK